MRVGIVDVDGHSFPNISLMKVAGYHRKNADSVEWHFQLETYDVVYMSKVFDETYSSDVEFVPIADVVYKGGTGYFRKTKDEKKQIYFEGRWQDVGESDLVEVVENGVRVCYTGKLPDNIERSCPMYGLYEKMTKDKAFGFLTRGCPRNCPFCCVSQKEGMQSKKVSDLDVFWNGQKNIVIMDPNILASKEAQSLLEQLAESKAKVDFNQGLDIRLVDKYVETINKIRVENIHFAWDNPRQDLREKFESYAKNAKHKVHGNYGTVYVLTNFDSSIEEDLYRIYTLRDLGYMPYVMIFDKPNASKEVRRMQRWCNSPQIFKSTKKFEEYR